MAAYEYLMPSQEDPHFTCEQEEHPYVLPEVVVREAVIDYGTSASTTEETVDAESSTQQPDTPVQPPESPRPYQSVLSDLYNLRFIIQSRDLTPELSPYFAQRLQDDATALKAKLMELGNGDIHAALTKADAVLQQNGIEATPAELLMPELWTALGLEKSPFAAEYELKKALEAREKSVLHQSILNMKGGGSMEQQIQILLDDPSTADFINDQMAPDQQETARAELEASRTKIAAVRDEFRLMRAMADEDGVHPWDTLDKETLLNLCTKYCLIPTDFFDLSDETAKQELLNNPRFEQLLDLLKNKGEGPTHLYSENVNRIVAQRQVTSLDDTLQAAQDSIRIVDAVNSRWDIPPKFVSGIGEIREIDKPDPFVLLPHVASLGYILDALHLAKASNLSGSSFLYNAAFIHTDEIRESMETAAKKYYDAVAKHIEVSRHLPKDTAQKVRQPTLIKPDSTAQMTPEAAGAPVGQLHMGKLEDDSDFGADGLRIYLAAQGNATAEDAHISLFFEPDGGVMVKEMQNKRKARTLNKWAARMLDDRAAPVESGSNYRKVELTLAESLQWMVDLGILQPDTPLAFERPENINALYDDFKRDELGDALDIYDPQKGAYATIRGNGQDLKVKDVIHDFKTRLFRTEVGKLLRNRPPSEKVEAKLYNVSQVIAKYAQGNNPVAEDRLQEEAEQIIQYYEKPAVAKLQETLRAIPYELDDDAYYRQVSTILGRYVSNSLRRESAFAIVSSLDPSNPSDAALIRAITAYANK